ncbi:MAG: PSD1 and planctomycete cytochrome C domain-containing protein [bacterium]|nr:PSD1 and planctomycete cytochrome C domain-containing protein [bacterium]
MGSLPTTSCGLATGLSTARPNILRLSLMTWALLAWPVAVQAQSLEVQVRKLLSGRCFACHGPDQAQRQGGFRLDLESSFTEPADSGTIPIAPGEPDQSELLRRLSSPDDSERMPPPEFGGPLSEEEIRLLRKWIELGAKLPRHWSFVPPQPARIPDWSGIQPAIRRSFPEWSQHPIDRFVLQTMQTQQLAPSPAAEKYVLLRRLSLDLTGLPPTLEELKHFEQNSSPEAYTAEVDRLLASPRFGEHWAARWLDLARYADSAGYADDPPRTIWAYRDWVIRAFNGNLGVDHFTRDQIAGDLLADSSEDQLIATAFHRNTLTNNEGGTNDEEFRNVAIVDRVNTTMSVWMGLTMGCAQCHTHKYDPFTQQEYFQLFAIFNQTQDADRKDEQPVLDLFTQAQKQQRQELRRLRSELQTEFAAQKAKQADAFESWRRELTAPAWSSCQPLEFRCWTGEDINEDCEASFEEMHRVRIHTGDTMPDQARYRLTLQLPEEFNAQPITGLSLVSLPDASLPGGAAGLGDGSFVITHVQPALIRESDDSADTPCPLPLRQAFADFAPEGFPAQAAVDEDPSSGWAVDGLEATSHRISFVFERPFVVGKNSRLELTIDQQSPRAQHLLASFRVEATRAEHLSHWAAMSPELRALHNQAQPEIPADNGPLLDFFVQQVADESRRVWERLQQAEQQLKSIQAYTNVPIMRELEASRRRDTFVQIRGSYKALGTRVDPGTPAALHPSQVTPEREFMNRLDLAAWLTSTENPLTARVWMNRLWESLFGIGLVRSSEEFGAQGELPSHPELLDWLALEFMDSGWDYKWMLRSIVTSQTYRQSAAVEADAILRDPDNVWLARGPRVRLTAEMIRDQALALSGLLSSKMYGPPVRPPQPDMGLKAAFGSATDWEPSHGEDRFRRGLYTNWRRSNPYPSLAMLDASSREVCLLQRQVTNTPLQALVTLNDPAFVEAAQGLARRVVIHSAALNNTQRLKTIFKLATGREPDSGELATLERLLQTAEEHLAKNPEAARKLASEPLGPLPDAADPVLMAAFTAVCNVVLNLDELLMKR